MPDTLTILPERRYLSPQEIRDWATGVGTRTLKPEDQTTEAATDTAFEEVKS